MEYKVIYSDRRTVSLSIKNEQLIVRAPYGVSAEKIESIVLSHTKWIDKNINRQREKRKKIRQFIRGRHRDFTKECQTDSAYQGVILC